jgi:hypothetical protein
MVDESVPCDTGGIGLAIKCFKAEDGDLVTLHKKGAIGRSQVNNG